MKPPEFDREEIYELWSSEPVEVIKTCRHVNLEPVWAGTNMVAQLCLDCDAQLDADGAAIARIEPEPDRSSRIAYVGPDRTPTAFWVPPKDRTALVVALSILAVIVTVALVLGAWSLGGAFAP